MKELEIAIIEIKEVHYFNGFNDEVLKEIGEDSIKLSMGMNLVPKKEMDELGIELNVKFDHNSNEVCSIKTLTRFKFFNIEGSENKIKFNKESVYLSDKLAEELLQTAIGGTRGMFAYKMASLSTDFIIPLFDLGEFIKNKNDEKEGK
ncbi:MAG: hypothetical protein HRT69_11095 [Flavobacteriaceae bacterium]|nr:hypothetical protein [Flavobacteriaceae bacterium]